MSHTRQDESRLLSADEHGLVAQAHYPALRAIDDKELADLVGLLRERRDRARDIYRQQRRETRGKSEPSGKTRATDSTGSKEKAGLIAAAVKRAGRESERRRVAAARRDLVSNSRRALAMRMAAGDASSDRPPSWTAGEGMHPIPYEGGAVSGAFEQEGQRVVLERSRKVR